MMNKFIVNVIIFISVVMLVSCTGPAPTSISLENISGSEAAILELSRIDSLHHLEFVNVSNKPLKYLDVTYNSNKITISDDKTFLDKIKNPFFRNNNKSLVIISITVLNKRKHLASLYHTNSGLLLTLTLIIKRHKIAVEKTKVYSI